MANEIQIFSNPQFGEIRTAIGKNGEPMFCLADVCKAVGLTNASSVKTRLDKDDVQVFDLHALKLTEGGTGNTKANFITENAFYDVLLYSDAPQVKPFRKWVTSEVLPTIRKHGAYATPQTIDSIIADPANGIKLLQALQEEREAKQLAQSQVAERDKTIGRLQPLADFAKTAFTSDTLVSISQAAKILKLPFGRNTLFKKLRESGIFFASKNEPKQKYVDADYFRMTEGNPIETSKGLMIPVTVYCTQKGLAYINLKFGNGRNNVPQLAKFV